MLKSYFTHGFFIFALILGDQILMINGKSTYQMSKEELRAKLQKLHINFEEFAPRGKETLKIGFMKSDEFNAERHLSKNYTPVPTKFIAFCTRCSPARLNIIYV